MKYDGPVAYRWALATLEDSPEKKKTALDFASWIDDHKSKGYFERFKENYQKAKEFAEGLN